MQCFNPNSLFFFFPLIHMEKRFSCFCWGMDHNYNQLDELNDLSLFEMPGDFTREKYPYVQEKLQSVNFSKTL